MKRLREEGFSLTQIARKLNVSKYTVFRYTKGIKKGERKEERFNVPGLGFLSSRTIGKLIEKGILKPKLSEEILEKIEGFDAVLVDDNGDRIIIKGIKKIAEIE